MFCKTSYGKYKNLEYSSFTIELYSTCELSLRYCSCGLPLDSFNSYSTNLFCSINKMYSALEIKGLDYSSLFLDVVVIISWHSTSDSAVIILEFELADNTFTWLCLQWMMDLYTLTEESPSPFEFKAWGQIQIAQTPFVSCLYLAVRRSSLRQIDWLFSGIA